MTSAEAQALAYANTLYQQQANNAYGLGNLGVHQDWRTRIDLPPKPSVGDPVLWLRHRVREIEWRT